MKIWSKKLLKKNRVYQFYKKYQNIFLSLAILMLIFLSRFLFISQQPEFFDANEYIWRTMVGNLKDAISTGHPPYHPGYLFFTYLTNRVLILLKINNPALAGSIPSAIFGSLTIFVFFYFVRDLINKKIALLASFILAILPYFWIANVTILVDSTMIFFYMLSLFLYNKWLDNKQWFFIFLSGIFLGMCIFTHTQIAFWVIVFPVLYIYKVSKKDLFKRITPHILWIVGPILSIITYSWLMVSSGFSQTYRDALDYLLFNNINDKASLQLFTTFTEYRIVIGLIGVLIVLIAIYKIFFEDRKLLLFLLFWLVPGLIISSQYQYANFYPRAIMIGIFPSCILISWFIIGLKNVKIKYFSLAILVISFLLQGLPYLYEIKTSVSPYNEINNYFKPGSKGVLIVSNLARTHIYSIQYKVVWENDIKEVKDTIQNKLNQNESAYITTDAITFPLWRYDGRRLEILSTWVGSESHRGGMMGNIITNYYLIPEHIFADYNNTIYKILDKPISKEEFYNLSAQKTPDDKKIVAGQIVDEATKTPIRGAIVSVYDNSKKSQIVKSRFDSSDLLYRIIKWPTNYRDPLAWAITDKNGFFSIPISKNIDKTKIIVGESNMNATNDFDQIKFTQNNSQKLELKESNSASNSGETNIAFIDKDSKKIFSTIYNFKLTNRLEGEDMAFEIGKIVKNEKYSNGQAVRCPQGKNGNVTYGPYQHLDKGKYKIKQKIFFDSNDQSPGYLEVAGLQGKKSYGKMVLNPKNEMQEMTFELTESDDVEYRVVSDGKGSFLVDYLELEKND